MAETTKTISTKLDDTWFNHTYDLSILRDRVLESFRAARLLDVGSDDSKLLRSLASKLDDVIHFANESKQ